MIFRKASNEDIQQIVLLWQEVANMHASWQPMFELAENAQEYYSEHLKIILANEDYHVIVAETENKIIGYSTLAFGNRPEVFLKRISASIRDTYVEAEYRKRGIGKQLTKVLIDLAKEKGVETISLSVAVDNEIGNIFWKEMGFEPTVNQMVKYLV